MIASRRVTTPSVALIASPVLVTVMTDISRRSSIDSILGRYADFRLTVVTRDDLIRMALTPGKTTRGTGAGLQRVHQPLRSFHGAADVAKN